MARIDGKEACVSSLLTMLFLPHMLYASPYYIALLYFAHTSVCQTLALEGESEAPAKKREGTQPKFKKTPVVLLDISWYRVVLDEGNAYLSVLSLYS